MYSPVIWHSIRLVVAFILACNYFLFQVELFEEEYQANHRQISKILSFASPHLTWESFDKENAPEAFVLNPVLAIELFGLMPIPQQREQPPRVPYQPIRDKSPPSFL